FGGKPDPYCYSLGAPNGTSATTYTGPNEVWWAPYDNKPPTTPAEAARDDYPRGLLWDYIEKREKIFKCPDGIERDPTSPDYGKPYQVSYGMNYVTGGPSGLRITDVTNGSSNVLIIWDHGRTPGCAYSKYAAPRGPWGFDGRETAADNAATPKTHYPMRHLGVMNAVFCDAHVAAVVPGDLVKEMFYAKDQ